MTAKVAWTYWRRWISSICATVTRRSHGLLITGETRSDRLREIMAANIPVLYKPVSPEQLREAMMIAWNVARTTVA